MACRNQSQNCPELGLELQGQFDGKFLRAYLYPMSYWANAAAGLTTEALDLSEKIGRIADAATVEQGTTRNWHSPFALKIQLHRRHCRTFSADDTAEDNHIVLQWSGRAVLIPRYRPKRSRDYRYQRCLNHARRGHHYPARSAIDERSVRCCSQIRVPRFR